MPSYAIAIANAARNVIAALSGAPSVVEVRKTDVVHPREINTPFAGVIIYLRTEHVLMAVSGAGSDTDQGDLLKAYELGISIYGTTFGDIASDMDTHPNFALRVKQALNKKSLAGVPTVYGTDLEDNAEWEDRRDFGDGNEVSRFIIRFFNAETKLGN